MRDPILAVTVVVPVGGVEGRLTHQLAAILSQQGPFAFEVVLSLNSSAERDRAALDEIVRDAGDQRVRVVSSSDKRGAAHARNVGAHAAHAPALAFCDADDVVRPGWLAALMDGLRSFDAVTGQVNDVAPRGQESWRPPATPGRLPTFLGAPYVLSGNLAITRAAFMAVGGFDETLTRCEDIALGWTLVSRGFRIGYASDAVLDYHHRSGLKSLIHQHYLYGQGMAEVISRYPVPTTEGSRRLKGLSVLRPNGQSASLNVPNVLRRAAIATGRVVGILRERGRRRRGQVVTD